MGKEIRSVNGGFFEEVYRVVRNIPKGKVATYGLVAVLTGYPRRARYVGYALHVNPEPYVIPCHRVVNRFGETSSAFAFGGEDVQRELLEKEGIVFENDGKVDLKKYAWDPFSEENPL